MSDRAILGCVAGLGEGGRQMTSLPPIGTPVSLRDTDGRVYASRLEDYDGNDIAIARPAGLVASVAYRDGTPFELMWTMQTGIYTVEVALAGSSVDGLVRLWHLEASGDVRIKQRRDYVRVPVTGLVRLSVARSIGAEDEADNDGVHDDSELSMDFDAALVDVSEVAAQCTVHVTTDDRRITAGTRLRCRFAIAGDVFDIIGVVSTKRPGLAAGENRIVIRFDHSEAAASALRRHVFRLQLEQRRERQQP